MRHPGRSRAPIAGVGLAIVLLAAGGAPAAADDTFVVQAISDDGDEDVGDGICDAAAGIFTACTLRAAIEEANSDPDQDRVEFQVGGPDASGVKVIQVGSTLEITEPLVIDGYTQPGASPNTRARGTNARLRIVLAGPGMDSGVTGLEVDASGTIRGLVLRGFEEAIMTRDPGVVIAGNFVGTNPDGSKARPNQTGIVVFDDSLIGGAARAARNLVSGNILGIHVVTPSDGARIQGNLVGTNARGRKPLPNSAGVVTASAVGTLVGGADRSRANVIAFNQNDGVKVDNAFGQGDASVVVRRNSIFSNGELGIDIGDDGREPNDNHPPLDSPPPPDTDDGPNGLQNFPLITSARTGANGTTIRGVLRSTPGRSFRLEFFSNPGGQDEGKRYLGARVVTTDADGLAGWTFKPKRRVPLGKAVTATATDTAVGATSEFSKPRTVRAS